MNGIDALIEKIDAKANRACEEKLAEAKAQAETVLGEYRSRGEAAARQIMERANAEAAAETLRAEGGDSLERSKKLLAAKHMMLNAAFERARNRLVNLSKDEKLAFFLKSLAAADCAGDELVLFNSRDRAELGAEAVARFNEALAAAGKTASLRLSEECREMDGGFILKSGNIETDCSMASVIAQTRTELSDEVVKVLFS